MKNTKSKSELIRYVDDLEERCGIKVLSPSRSVLEFENERMKAQIESLCEKLLSGKKYLDCQYCHKMFLINEMYSVDACCEDHQKELVQ